MLLWLILWCFKDVMGGNTISFVRKSIRDGSLTRKHVNTIELVVWFSKVRVCLDTCEAISPCLKDFVHSIQYITPCMSHASCQSQDHHNAQKSARKATWTVFTFWKRFWEHLFLHSGPWATQDDNNRKHCITARCNVTCSCICWKN